MMDPSEVEFLSENRHVKILPNFRNCHMFLIGISISMLLRNILIWINYVGSQQELNLHVNFFGGLWPI